MWRTQRQRSALHLGHRGNNSPLRQCAAPLKLIDAYKFMTMAEDPKAAETPVELRYIQYDNSQEEKYLPAIRGLISKDLSEPYSIYVYRYFLHQWGDLCFMVSGIFINRCPDLLIY